MSVISAATNTRRATVLASAAAVLEIGGGLLVIPYLVLAAVQEDPTSGLAQAINWTSWGMVCAAICLRRLTAPSWDFWVRRQAFWIAVTVLSFPLIASAPLHALRLLRLTTAFRLFGGVRRLLELLGRREALAALALASSVTVIGGGLLFGAVEPSVKAGSWDGVWWALETATTVGYGDVVPTTVAGRLVAVVVMVFGVGLVASFTAALATAVLTERPGRSPRDPLLEEVVERLERIERHQRSSRPGAEEV